MDRNKRDIVVVGGGLGGWIAAVYAARAGKRVLLAEKANAFGGRAGTVVRDGVALNLGAHAVYRDGELPAILKELGIVPAGGVPASAGHGVWNGGIHTLPGSPMSLLATRMLSWRGKVELGRIMAKVKKLDENRLPAGTLREWAERNIREPQARHLIYTLCRTASYAHRPDIQLAGPVVRQIKHVLNGGVLYVDGGWQTMIDSLRKTAEATGRVEAVSGKAVLKVSKAERLYEDLADSPENGRFAVRFADGETVVADGVILAVPPAECCRIFEGADRTVLEIWRKQARPVTSACLDLVMRKLPRPDIQFVMGVDSPFLFTNLSRASKLSDNGLIAVSMLKYHGAAQPDAERDRADIERTLDLLQPGWRQEVVGRQYLPNMIVVHDHPHAMRTSIPGPAVSEMPGLYVAGDWAGHRELLADAAAASAKRAAEACLREVSQYTAGGGRNGSRPAV
ncbi:FAD-dependent oxidoreductase [Paenibacillus hamazuiensis]|uniref:FAD-dependent oxidoreductase n=1 Tax=Paenibacillus hamazuiensis TaxID=2936508 RepID=UPI00200D2571|nr:FAD-dependent oxidoreductase [Paenibacillus hamazuiensis]